MSGALHAEVLNALASESKVFIEGDRPQLASGFQVVTPLEPQIHNGPDVQGCRRQPPWDSTGLQIIAIVQILPQCCVRIGPDSNEVDLAPNLLAPPPVGVGCEREIWSRFLGFGRLGRQHGVSVRNAIRLSSTFRSPDGNAISQVKT